MFLWCWYLVLQLVLVADVLVANVLLCVAAGVYVADDGITVDSDPLR